MMSSGQVTYTGDSPPANYPTVLNPSAGVYTVTLGTPFTDEAGVSGGFVPRFVTGSYSGETLTNQFVEAAIVGQVITIKHWIALSPDFPGPDRTSSWSIF
jgi:hypothetical protein